MLDDIDWLMDARWIVVDAKKVCRVSVKAARDGDGSVGASILVGWSWRLAGCIHHHHRPSVPHDYQLQLHFSRRDPAHHTQQHASPRREIVPHNMALPKRIIKETERLMAEP
jgi:hypothetical protein